MCIKNEQKEGTDWGGRQKTMPRSIRPSRCAQAVGKREEAGEGLRRRPALVRHGGGAAGKRTPLMCSMLSFSTRVTLPLAPGVGRLARSRCAVAVELCSLSRNRPCFPVLAAACNLIRRFPFLLFSFLLQDRRGCSHFGLLCSFQFTVAHCYHTKADLPSRLVLASSCHKPSSLGVISTELCERIISMQWWFMISTELYSTMTNASYTSVSNNACYFMSIPISYSQIILGQTSARGSAGGRDHCLTHHRTTTCTPVTNETRDL